MPRTQLEEFLSGECFAVYALVTGAKTDAANVLENDPRMTEDERNTLIATVDKYAETGAVHEPTHKTLSPRVRVGSYDILLHEFRHRRWRLIWFSPPSTIRQKTVIIAQVYYKRTRAFPKTERNRAERYVKRYLALEGGS